MLKNALARLSQAKYKSALSHRRHAANDTYMHYLPFVSCSWNALVSSCGGFPCYSDPTQVFHLQCLVILIVLSNRREHYKTTATVRFPIWCFKYGLDRMSLLNAWKACYTIRRGITKGDAWLYRAAITHSWLKTRSNAHVFTTKIKTNASL